MAIDRYWTPIAHSAVHYAQTETASYRPRVDHTSTRLIARSRAAYQDTHANMFANDT